MNCTRNGKYKRAAMKMSTITTAIIYYIVTLDLYCAAKRNDIQLEKKHIGNSKSA